MFKYLPQNCSLDTAVIWIEAYLRCRGLKRAFYTDFGNRKMTKGQLFSLKFLTLTDFSDRERVLKLEIARNLVNIDDRKGPIQRKIQV